MKAVTVIHPESAKSFDTFCSSVSQGQLPSVGDHLPRLFFEYSHSLISRRTQDLCLVQSARYRHPDGM